MLNELIVVAVTPFSGTTTPDKNGKQAVMLQCIAGRMPNRNTLSGTVAERAGFEIGKTYLAQVRETGKDFVYGLDFTFIKVKELLTGSDIADTIIKLGPPEIILISRPEGFEKTYERKGDAVESIRTKRIREGLYEPAIPRNVEHETAKEVKEGTTITGASDMQKNLTPEDLEKNLKQPKTLD